MNDGARAPRCLLAVCGLPGAGKSTLCRALAAHLAAVPGWECVCVCFDALERAALGPAAEAPFDAARWKARRLTHNCNACAALRDALARVVCTRFQAARVEALAQLDAHLRAERAADAPPLLLIADDAAHLTSMRRELFVLARTRASCAR